MKNKSIVKNLRDTTCPLCGRCHSQFFFEDQRRAFLRCQHCLLVFVPESFHLTIQQEKGEYDLHENVIDDPGYRCFLSRISTPLREKLKPETNGLDFGCGPGPALAIMLEEAGHSVLCYDPIYAPINWSHQKYDFITATEVVEHLRHPGAVLRHLLSTLRVGGWLAIMTKLVQSRQAFARWHYKNDLTHIAFFSKMTFTWLAKEHCCHLEFHGNDVILLQRQ